MYLAARGERRRGQRGKNSSQRTRKAVRGFRDRDKHDYGHRLCPSRVAIRRQARRVLLPAGFLPNNAAGLSQDSPCAVSSYTMARQMDSDYELSAGTVVFTTMLSCFTLFGWIYFLKELNFF